jgi:hypothetical protein
LNALTGTEYSTDGQVSGPIDPRRLSVASLSFDRSAEQDLLVTNM